MRNPRHFTNEKGSFEGFPPGVYKLFDGLDYYYVRMPEDEDMGVEEAECESAVVVPIELINRWLTALGIDNFWDYYQDDGSALSWDSAIGAWDASE